jgi:hypothetical protein
MITQLNLLLELLFIQIEKLFLSRLKELKRMQRNLNGV